MVYGHRTNGKKGRIWRRLVGFLHSNWLWSQTCIFFYKFNYHLHIKQFSVPIECHANHFIITNWIYEQSCCVLDMLHAMFQLFHEYNKSPTQFNFMIRHDMSTTIAYTIHMHNCTVHTHWWAFCIQTVYKKPIHWSHQLLLYVISHSINSIYPSWFHCYRLLNRLWVRNSDKVWNLIVFYGFWWYIIYDSHPRRDNVFTSNTWFPYKRDNYE